MDVLLELGGRWQFDRKLLSLFWPACLRDLEAICGSGMAWGVVWHPHRLLMVMASATHHKLQKYQTFSDRLANMTSWRCIAVRQALGCDCGFRPNLFYLEHNPIVLNRKAGLGILKVG